MFKAKIEVAYKIDWSINLMKEFKSEMESIYCQNIYKNKVVDLIKIKRNLNAEKRIDYIFAEFDNIVDYEIIDKTDKYFFIKIITICESNNEKFVKNNCFQINSILLKDGKEYWNVISNNKQNFKNLIKDLKQNKNNKSTKLISLKSYTFEKDNLTDKQLDTLKFLHNEGYFNIPKNITLEKCAKKLKTTKSNLNVHLNKTVSKLISNFLK